MFPLVFLREAISVIFIGRYVTVMFVSRLLLAYVVIPTVHREVERFKWNSHRIQKQRYLLTRWCSETYAVFQRNTDWISRQTLFSPEQSKNLRQNK